jgi:REP element-mobilizing transposase RayT
VKIKGEIAHYHIISRTVGQQFLLGEVEKEMLVQIIHFFSNMYFVKLNAYCIMSNHFHLVVRMLPGHMFSDEEVARRILTFMQDDDDKKKKTSPEEISAEEIRKARAKLEDLSEFCRSFKQTFSRWYNKANDRTGYFWGDRFKSLHLENQESILRCCAYIELNPVRAGIVEKPENYRWCSIHNRQFAPRRQRFCSFDGMFTSDLTTGSEARLLKEYRCLVHYLGNIEHTTHKESTKGRSVDDNRSPIGCLKLAPGERLLKRIRYFTDGVAIGSKDFIIQIYKKFAGTAILKKDRNIYPTGIAPNLFSIKRLRPKAN